MPVYTIVNDGKKFWIILMVDSGKYYNGLMRAGL